MTEAIAVKRLSRRSKALYRRIVDDYELGPHHLRLLELFCEALDRAEAAQAEIDEHGITTQDRFGQTREHPAVKTKRDAEVAAARLLRELDLDDEPAPDVRPPRVPGRYR
jgi:P27 family predicted phage terminase small subunit